MISPDRMGDLLLAFASLVGKDENARSILDGGLYEELLHEASNFSLYVKAKDKSKVHRRNGNSPDSEHNASGKIDIFDEAALALENKLLANLLFGKSRAEVVYYTTYRLSAVSGKIARSLTAFYPPHHPENFVRFSNWLHMAVNEHGPTSLREAKGVALRSGRCISLVANINDLGAKLISLVIPETSSIQPYFNGLVQTCGRKTIVGARILMVRNLRISGAENFRSFAKTLPVSEAIKSFADEIAALEGGKLIEKDALHSEKLVYYISNDVGEKGILTPGWETSESE